MDEDDRDSNGFSDNDQDEVMEDVDKPENDPEPEDDEDEPDDEESDPDADVYPDHSAARQNRDVGARSSAGPRGASPGQAKLVDSQALGQVPEQNGTEAYSGEQPLAATATADVLAASVSARSSAQPKTGSSTPLPASRLRLTPGLEALTARVYDIVPTMAAPQATSINALAVTPDLRYWMTGGSDGYIRKYDGPGTINGRQLLTVAQRHPFVDSVVKAGILMSYWENEEPPTASARGAEDHILSPVYSLAVHSRALWLLAGTEGGGINLQSVRHDEGKRITCLQRHTNAVSVLQLAPDEKSALSGSWDKNIFDWDLSNGQLRRQFDGSGGQISAIELRPASGAPIVVQDTDEEPVQRHHGTGTATSSNGRPLPNGVSVNAAGGAGAGVNGNASISGASATVNGDDPMPDHESLFGSPSGSLFGGSEALGGHPFGNDDLGGDVDITVDSGSLHAVGGFSEDVDMVLGGSEAAADVFAPAAASPAVPEAAADELATADNGGEAAEANVAPGTPTADGGGGGLPSADAAVPFAGDLAAGVVAEGLISSDSASLSQQQQQQNDKSDAASGAPNNAQSSGEADEQAPAVAAAPTLGTAAGTSPAGNGEPTQSTQAAPSQLLYSSQPGPTQFDPTQVSETTFFSASMDGTIRIWDRRQSLPVARIANRPGVPPWCMGACWSPDGNRIYAGRRNGIVEEFDIHKARNGWQPERALKFPAVSGPISAVRAMVNGRHLVCASHDILRLYDLQDTSAFRHSHVPFLIIPGPPRPGVISHLYIDQTCRYMISTAGTRGWEGTNTEVLIGYEINAITK